MITTLSDMSSFITAPVGSENRVRVGQKSGIGGTPRTSEQQPPVFIKGATQEKEKIHASNREHLHAMARRLQEVLHHVEPRIELSLEKDINRVILRVVDKESGDLIRQIPPEKVIELDRFLSGQFGLLVEEDV